MLNSSDPAGIDGWFLAFEAKMKQGESSNTLAERFESVQEYHRTSRHA